MMAATGMPPDESTSRVACCGILAQNPTLTLAASLPECFDFPARGVANDRLNLLRCLSRKQSRVVKDVVNSRDRRR